VRGGSPVATEFERQLGVKPGETTPDGRFTLETVNCLGCCAIGPVVVVDGEYNSQVGVRHVEKLITENR
jgi:NADH-quinone oxidoreductase subunit E